MRIGSLFIDIGETVMGWFKARAYGYSDDYNKIRKETAKFVIPEVKRDLVKLGFRKIQIRWSIHAGCSMCPCSPGYIIIATHPNDDVTSGIRWAGRKDDDKAYVIAYYFSDGKLRRDIDNWVAERYLKVPKRKDLGKVM